MCVVPSGTSTSRWKPSQGFGSMGGGGGFAGPPKKYLNISDSLCIAPRKHTVDGLIKGGLDHQRRP